jgi:hypothetical protein
MALIVRVYVNQTQVAVAAAQNMSNLADVSNYDCQSITAASKFTDFEELRHEFKIEDHDRTQPVWDLVAKMAQHIAELEVKS